MKGYHNTKRRQRGASTVETAIMSLLMFSLLLGAFQGLLLYRAKITLNHSVTEAVRTGAVNHTSSSAMTSVMAEQLSPLYGGWGTGGAEGLATAIVKAKADLAIPLGIGFNAGAGYEMQILSPTVEAFEDFGEDVDGQVEIPNHHLRARDRSIGSSSKVNVQDANLLKIRATYGYKLTVPLASDIIATIMTVADPDRAHYYAADPPRIPLTSTAIARMQSAPRVDEAQLSLKTKLGSGGAGTVPPEDFTEEDAKELEDEITNPGGPTDPTDPTDPVDPTDPEKEIECDTTWDDEQYNGWFSGNWNAAKDFFTGLIDGFKQQLGDLWELVKDVFTDWDAMVDILKEIWDDPKQFLKDLVQALVDDLGEKAQKIMKCGPKDIGKILGEEISPVKALQVVGKIAKISKKLAKYIKKIDDNICASFPAGTAIWTPSGPIKIENLHAQALVASRSDTSYITTPQPVLETYNRTADGYITISTDRGDIALTREHPVWLQGEGWLIAGDVESGHVLATLTGDVAVNKTEFHETPKLVYNFSVDQTPNYFAGEMKLWVHNKKYHDCSKLNGDSGKLRKQLTNDPHFKDPHFQAHHIVPSELVGDAKYKELFEAARDSGYDINGERNGILLPDNDDLSGAVDLPKHRGSHPLYTQHVKDKMDDIAKKHKNDLDNPPLSDKVKQEIRNDIERLQDELEEDMRDGTIGVANKTWDTE